jgi:hypothetical protein
MLRTLRQVDTAIQRVEHDGILLAIIVRARFGRRALIFSRQMICPSNWDFCAIRRERLSNLTFIITSTGRSSLPRRCCSSAVVVFGWTFTRLISAPLLDGKEAEYLNDCATSGWNRPPTHAVPVLPTPRAAAASSTTAKGGMVLTNSPTYVP